jgi:hypothetical protein
MAKREKKKRRRKKMMMMRWSQLASWHALFYRE